MEGSGQGEKWIKNLEERREEKMNEVDAKIEQDKIYSVAWFEEAWKVMVRGNGSPGRSGDNYYL